MKMRIEKEKLPRKIWAFLEKNYDLLFLRFYNRESFEAGGGLRNKVQMSSMPPSLTQSCWGSQVTFCH